MYTKQNFEFLPKTKLSSLGGEGGGVMIKGKLSLTDFAVFPTLLKCKVGCHTDEDCAYGLRCRTEASQRVCLHKYLSKSNATPTDDHDDMDCTANSDMQLQLLFWVHSK